MPMLTSDCKSWLPKLSFLASFSVLQLVRARIEEGRGWKRVQGIQCAHPCRNTSWVAFSSLSCFLCACACLCGRVSVIMYEEFADLYTVYFSPNATLAVVGLVWSCRLMDGKVADEIVHLSEGQWWRTARLERGCLSHLVGFFFFFHPVRAGQTALAARHSIQAKFILHQLWGTFSGRAGSSAVF